MKPGKLEVLDIDDTFCAAHGGQQLAFWNAHHDERGFASTHVYHVASGTPVAAILRPACTPKGSEVRAVIKHAGTSSIPILSAAAPGLHASSAFFMGSDAPVPAASALRLFSNAAFANIAPSSVHTPSDKRLPKPSSSSNVGSGSRRGPPQRAGALDAFAATP